MSYDHLQQRTASQTGVLCGIPVAPACHQREDQGCEDVGEAGVEGP